MSSTKIANYGVDNYKIKLNSGGTFSIDTGDGAGEVRISGDLIVTGDITQTELNEVVVRDRTITVNDGEEGNGISSIPGYEFGSQYAGIVIDRGNFPDAKMMYDEDLTWYDSQTGLEDPNTGAFVFKIKGGSDSGGEQGELQGIFTNFIGTFNNTDLVLLGAQDHTGKVTVTNTVDYERNIFPYTGDSITVNPFAPDNLTPINDPDFDDDAIPNIKLMLDYIRDYHVYNFQDKILSLNDTSISVSDFTSDSSAISNAKVTIDSTDVAEFYLNKIKFNGVEFEDNTIRARIVNQNLILEGNAEGVVQFNTPAYFPKYDDVNPGDTDPDVPADGITLYSKEEADGGTGLFFVNENGTQDEIISRNKALLYSIIF